MWPFSSLKKRNLEKVKMEKMYQKKLENHLACPICSYVSRNTNIIICQNGHHMCFNCYEKIANKKCPTCRVDYPTVPTRVCKMEEMIKEDFEFPCSFHRSECQFKGVESSLKVHERDCKFRK